MTIVAIDFGTSNTVVSILEPSKNSPKTLHLGQISRNFKMMRSGKFYYKLEVSNAQELAKLPPDEEIMKAVVASSQKNIDEEGKVIGGKFYDVSVVPTQVFIKKHNHIILGQQVESQRMGLQAPERLFKNFKRDLAADIQPPARQIDGSTYTITSVAELFLKEIWQQLDKQGIQPSQVIFTVPVGAFESYLDWFCDLGSRLGVSDVRLVDESTAAALGYAVQRPGVLVLVVDFGGGTLDLSLVRTVTTHSQTGSNQNILKAEVLAKTDAYVGGSDIDSWIVEDYLRQIGLSREAVGEIGWYNLLDIAEKLKITLSLTYEAEESWVDKENAISYDLKLNQPELKEILEKRQFLAHLREALDEILALANNKDISTLDIEQVLLVGGSCLIPAVQEVVVSYFGKEKVNLNKPLEAVAHGALALSQLSNIDDYLHHAYAIRVWEPYLKKYSYLPLFEKGTLYPFRHEEPLTFQVAEDLQGEIKIDIGELAEISQVQITYDAQNPMTSNKLRKQLECRLLNRDNQQTCVAHLDPPGRTNMDRIAVWFEVDERRVLRATVRDLLTGKVLVDRGEVAKL